MTLPGGRPAGELYEKLSQAGDFRRGSLNEVRRKRGKPDCPVLGRAIPGAACSTSLSVA
jgi:hypothetical protein